MDQYKIEDFFRGWFIGDFTPSILKTSQFEVGVLKHKKDEIWPQHFHKVATEYNLLISGTMIINGSRVNPGDIFVLNPGEVADPKFISDCSILVIKTPSIPGDKFEV